MSKDLMKIALIGLTAGVCLSAQDLSAKSTNVLAMSKCSKDDSSCSGKTKCNGEDSDESCSGDSGCSAQSESPSSEMKEKRSNIANKSPESVQEKTE